MLYAFALGPAIWTLSGVAFTQNLTGRARNEQTVEALVGLLLLLLAGAAYAILLLARFSPVGPTAVGGVFLLVSLWVLANPEALRDLLPAAVTKPGFDLTLPGQGMAALLAVPLLCTALSTRRWRESRFQPDPAAGITFAWPFARPSRPGTLVVPGVTATVTAEATQVLPTLPADTTTTRPLTEADRTMVVPAQGAPPEATMPIDRVATAPMPAAAPSTPLTPMPADAAPLASDQLTPVPADAPAAGDTVTVRSEEGSGDAAPVTPRSGGSGPLAGGPITAEEPSGNPAPMGSVNATPDAGGPPDGDAPAQAPGDAGGRTSGPG